MEVTFRQDTGEFAAGGGDYRLEVGRGPHGSSCQKMPVAGYGGQARVQAAPREGARGHLGCTAEPKAPPYRDSRNYATWGRPAANPRLEGVRVRSWLLPFSWALS